MLGLIVEFDHDITCSEVSGVAVGRDEDGEVKHVRTEAAGEQSCRRASCTLHANSCMALVEVSVSGPIGRSHLGNSFWISRGL